MSSLNTGHDQRAQLTGAHLIDSADQTHLIYTGRLAWTASSCDDKPIVPFEELPLQGSPLTKVPPCAVRWQFTSSFDVLREDRDARGLIYHQVVRSLRSKGFEAPDCIVQFPPNIGRRKLVDVVVKPSMMAALADTSLVFKGAKLQRMFVGPVLPLDSVVLTIEGVHNRANAVILKIVEALQSHGKVHDIWVVQVSNAYQDSPPTDTTRLEALVAVPQNGDSGSTADRLHAIPAYLHLHGQECEVCYAGRPDWCTACKSGTRKNHTKEDCPRRCDPCGDAIDCSGQSVPKDDANAGHVQKQIEAVQNSEHSSTEQISGFRVATWNCATLQDPSRIQALHQRATPLGSADIVFIQEMRLLFPFSLPSRNSFQALHQPFANYGHQAILGRDTGILLRHPDWVIEDSFVRDYVTYARVRVPDAHPSIGQRVRVLHLWSIHAPPGLSARDEFWDADVPGLSCLDAASLENDVAAIIGADWNAVVYPLLDNFPPKTSDLLPLGQLAQAGLVDTYRTLHPEGTSYTRFHVIHQQLVSARRIDSIWVSKNLVPLLESVATLPSQSDHSIVCAFFKSPSLSQHHLGPGNWTIHRQAHLQPEFQPRMKDFASHLQVAEHDPVQDWFAFVERTRTAAANICHEMNRKLEEAQVEHAEILQELHSIDIRRGEAARSRFLRLRTRMRQLETSAAETTAGDGIVRDTSWLARIRQSRAFAPLPSLSDRLGEHHTIVDKLSAIYRFYSTLFKPKPRDQTTEESSSILLSYAGKVLSSATRQAMETPFTVEELRKVLDCARDGSAPGLDGLTFPLLKTMGDAPLERLAALGNALFEGHQLPEGEPSLRGVLLPKRGDLSNLWNYRPISIASVAFRLLGKAVSERLQAAAKEVISPAQTGFIRGRQSAFGMINLYLLQHAVQTGSVSDPILVLKLDQEKAFDRVRRSWLLDCLSSYGFGQRFLRYIREVYRHPSSRQSAEGHFTEPFALHCGILQGDPMSSLLYNISLQPLLDFVSYHHHAGVKLSWDPLSPLMVSSLAFADDTLFVVEDKTDMENVLGALDFYELASNAKVSDTKSQAFVFSKGPEPNCFAENVPFDIVDSKDAEIVHLGYPFRLDGGVPHSLIETRLAGVQAKINVIVTANTDLFTRVRICNSSLLSRLWHAIRLCPLPQQLQRKVNAVINPFLFLGRRNWIKHIHAIAPRHLGGLGLIESSHMAVALLGQVVAGLLQSSEPVGSQFRAALQQHLWDEYKAIPAHFVLRRGLPWMAMCSIVTAQKSFMCRVVYTLTQLRLSVEPDWASITVPELLSLPFYSDIFGFTWPKDIHVANLQAWERNGLRVWGDWLWYNPNEKGKLPHPNSIVAAWPLVPPSASGTQNNYVASRGHPDNAADFMDAAGRLLPKIWRDMWPCLHPQVAAKLLDIRKHYHLHPDTNKNNKNPRPHDRPYKIDTIGLPFPWRFATLAGKPVAEYTVKSARAFLSGDKVAIPDWDFESNEGHWRQVWIGLTNENLLSTAAQSDVFLFLHRRPWLAQKPRHERRLDNYGSLNDNTFAERLPFLERDIAEPDERAEPEGSNDAYEAEHVFGVTTCMLCHGPKDSALHGYVECPHVQEAWRNAMATLNKLVGSNKAVPLDARSLVLGWPDLKIPAAFRSRVLLWRDTAIHLLASMRHAAIAEGLRNDFHPQMALVADNFGKAHAALVATSIADGYDRCAPETRPQFLKRWIDRGTFLKLENDALTFHSMQARPAAASTSQPPAHT